MVWRMLYSVFLHSGSGWGIEVPRLSSNIPKISGHEGDDLFCEQILCQKICLLGWDPQGLHPLGLWHSIKNLKWVIGKKGSCRVLSTLLENRLCYFALLLGKYFSNTNSTKQVQTRLNWQIDWDRYNVQMLVYVFSRS